MTRPPQPFAAIVGPVIVAHRGGALEAPENTVAAVKHAEAAGADWVEVDVTLTKDDEVVVLHDDDVSRTTTGTGLARALTLKQLQALPAGSPGVGAWAQKHMDELGIAAPAFGERFAAARVPSLKEVLLAAPDMRFMIELKTIPEKKRLVQRVVEVVRDLNVHERVAIASFDDWTLMQAYYQAPAIPRIGIAEGSAQLTNMLELPVQVVAVYTDLVEEALSKVPPPTAVWAWTAYNLETAVKLRDQGVAGIITDVPKAVLNAMRPEPSLYVGE